MPHAAGAAMISYSPAQELHTWWERALIPFVFCRLSQLYSYAAVNDPQSPAAAANGQYLLIRRDAYDAIGGHAAVCGEVLEDVALARRAKAAGVALHFAPGAEIARVRMYASFRAMWEGWTKNLFPLVKTPGQTVTRELFSVIPWIPLLCFWRCAVARGLRGPGDSPARGPPRQLRGSASPESFPVVGRPILSSWCCPICAVSAVLRLALRPRQGSLEGPRIPGRQFRTRRRVAAPTIAKTWST